MLKKNNKKIIILMSILSIMSLVYLISAEPSFPEPLSQLNPGDSIQDAINSSSPGDIIELNDGVYNSDGDYDINVTVDSLTIKAVDGANPIINATGKNKRVFMINSNNVTLDGLTITGGNNTQSSNDGRAGGVYSNANNTTISNCNITQNFASAGSGGGIYFSLRNGNNNVIGCNIIGNTATSGSGGGVNIDTGNVIDCNITGNTAINNAGGGAYIVYGNMIGCNITNNKANSPGGGVYIYSGNVSACNIINNIATGSAGGVNIGNSGNISYNRICNNNASNGANLYTTSNNVVYDYNWWGTNNISLAGLSSPADPDTYFVIQLSVNDSWTRTNTTEKFGDNLSLNYTMVLNSTNNSDDNDKLPDFSVAISLTGLINEVVNATAPWSKNISVPGNYIFRSVCDNEDLHIISHPIYDLKLTNEPQGQIMVGSWIKSVATAIGDFPLPTDYVRFKVTSLSDNNVQYDVNKSFGDSNSVFYDWQLTKKDTYKVEVWAYDENGFNVKVPPLLGTRAMKLSVGYNPYYSVDYIDVRGMFYG